MQIRQVLLATDFSAAADAAAEVAREMAVALRARLHVVHVVPPLTDPAYQAERLAREAHAGVPCETALLQGRPGAALLRYAREHAIDLIVVGSHGRTGISHLLLGSVAEEVVRLAPCLVLTVPATLAVPEAERVAAVDVPASRHCLVCARAADELICGGCRERIRGEALVRKREAERPGRREG
jgi:nucleotide-binding universal stress UspA family protein